MPKPVFGSFAAPPPPSSIYLRKLQTIPISAGQIPQLHTKVEYLTHMSGPMSAEIISTRAVMDDTLILEPTPTPSILDERNLYSSSSYHTAGKPVSVRSTTSSEGSSSTSSNEASTTPPTQNLLWVPASQHPSLESQGFQRLVEQLSSKINLEDAPWLNLEGVHGAHVDAHFPTLLQWPGSHAATKSAAGLHRRPSITQSSVVASDLLPPLDGTDEEQVVVAPVASASLRRKAHMKRRSRTQPISATHQRSLSADATLVSEQKSPSSVRVDTSVGGVDFNAAKLPSPIHTTESELEGEVPLATTSEVVPSALASRKQRVLFDWRSLLRSLSPTSSNSPSTPKTGAYEFVFPADLDQQLYRMSRLKLFSTKRPLQQQVLISNILLSIMAHQRKDQAEIAALKKQSSKRRESAKDSRRAKNAKKPVAAVHRKSKSLSSSSTSSAAIMEQPMMVRPLSPAQPKLLQFDEDEQREPSGMTTMPAQSTNVRRAIMEEDAEDVTPLGLIFANKQ